MIMKQKKYFVNAFISMDDDPATILRKFKRAVTDSDDKIVYSPEKPGISNLIVTIGNCSLKFAQNSCRVIIHRNKCI